MDKIIVKNFWVFLIIFFSFSLGAKDTNKQVNILTWADYIQTDILKQFEQETGIKVNVDFIDSHFSLESKIISANHAYDVVIPTLSPFFIRQVSFDLYQTLDHSKFKNYKYIDPKIISLEKSSNNSQLHAVPFMIDTVGIGYNHKKVFEIMPNAPVNSLSMIFDPNIVKNFESCGVEMLESPEEIISLALLYLGLEPNSEKEEDLTKAAEVLYKIRPFLRSVNSALYFNNLGSGDNCLVIGYSGDVIHAQKMAAENDVEIKYSLPKEGTIMNLDLLAITKNASNLENAYKFIDFIMRPDINAKIANFIGFTSPNLASFPLIRKELREDPSVYPFQHKIDRFFILGVPSANFNRLRNRSWMKFLSYE